MATSQKQVKIYLGRQRTRRRYPLLPVWIAYPYPTRQLVMGRRVAVGGEGKRNVMMRCPRTNVANSRRERNAKIRAAFGREVIKHAKEGEIECDNFYF